MRDSRAGARAHSRALRSAGDCDRLPVSRPPGELAMAFYELRQYHINPGKMDEWVAFMEGTIIPFQVSQGMVITGSYRGEEDDSVYVWTRRFESEAQREALYTAVYESDFWKNDVSPKVGELIDRSKINVQRIVPTPKSVTQ
jgi:hypothetical protein